jgi:hypothetical protein
VAFRHITSSECALLPFSAIRHGPSCPASRKSCRPEFRAVPGRADAGVDRVRCLRATTTRSASPVTSPGMPSSWRFVAACTHAHPLHRQGAAYGKRATCFSTPGESVAYIVNLFGISCLEAKAHRIPHVHFRPLRRLVLARPGWAPLRQRCPAALDLWLRNPRSGSMNAAAPRPEANQNPRSRSQREAGGPAPTGSPRPGAC